MKKFKIVMFSLLLGSAFITACSEGIGDDPLAGSINSEGAVIVGWAAPTVSEAYFSDIGTVNKTYAFNVLGGGNGAPTTSDITITLSVDTANSTAVEGHEFAFPSSSVTIPAGTSISQVPIDINTGAFNPTAPTSVVINATTTTDGVVIAAPAQTFTLTFVGCKSNLADYTYEMTLEGRGRTYGPVLETLTEVSVNSFVTYSVGYWGFDPFNIGNGVRFSDICGTLTIPVQDLAAYYSNEVGPLGTATVDENGNFTLNYYISLSGENVPMKATYIRQ